MAKQLCSQGMRATCNGCSKEVKTPVLCEICCELYHPSCAAITKVQRGGGKVDACRSCVNARNVSSNHPSTSRSSIEELLNNFITSQNAQNQEISAKLDAVSKLTDKIDAVLSSHAELIAQLEVLNSANHLLTDKCNTLEARVTAAEQLHANEVKDLRMQNDQLQSRVAVLERKELGCCLVISGVPERPQEQLRDIFKQICDRLSVSIDINDIEDISRMKSINQSNRAKMLFVKLKSMSHRNRIVAARRRKQSFFANEICDLLPKAPIYINEYVQPRTLQLLRDTKELAKQRKYRYVWIMNGNVCVRKDNISPTIKIFNSSEIPAKLV
jgi:hypothetical protein